VSVLNRVPLGAVELGAWLGDLRWDMMAKPPRRASAKSKQIKHRVEKGVYRDGRGYKVCHFFNHFGIEAHRLKSVSGALEARCAMHAVESLVRARLRKLVLARKAVTREQFVRAMKAAVAEARASKPNLVPFRYFAKIEKPGKEKAVRSFMNPSLDEALKGWARVCESEGVDDIAALDGIDEKRRAADAFAKDALATLPPTGWPTDAMALSALRLWGFDKNPNRENVFPDGVIWVHSDTLGVIRDYNTGKHRISQASIGYEHFHRLLVRWVRGRLPPRLRKQPLPYTSISVNKNYAARLHRDRSNEGPSVALAVGAFTGGRLRYWPGDSKHGDLEQLRGQPSVLLDLKKAGPCIFDGNCAHEVQPFKGERFSLVLFSAHGYERASQPVKNAIKEAGGAWPSPVALQRLRQQLSAKTKPRGARTSED